MLGVVGGVFQLLLLALLLFACAWVIRRVQTHNGAGWMVKSTLVLLGVATGIGLCFIRYQPKPDVVIFGLPLPLAIFQREGSAWVDYVVHPMMMLLVGVLNILIVTAVIHAIALGLLTVIQRRREAASS